MSDSCENRDFGVTCPSRQSGAGGPFKKGGDASGMKTVADSLCLHCGLCCNGVLFRDVEIQPEDDREHLRAAGLSVRQFKRKCAMPQPCGALQADLRCRVYSDRPARCRSFECLLFKSVAGGGTSLNHALGVIRKTRRAASNVARLLGLLGDQRTDLPLARRFKWIQSRLHRTRPDEATLGTFAELTLAVQDLNLMLQRDFHP